MGNFDLCYKHSISLEELHLGIARCDKHGMPILPPPAMIRHRRLGWMLVVVVMKMVVMMMFGKE
ncbi:hypothetical protein HanIR_Chr15g0757221 [Helianthus annuus]|nr:hypothetical protein HanIR_Chr15g0757221 [Helianthus annuus]